MCRLVTNGFKNVKLTLLLCFLFLLSGTCRREPAHGEPPSPASAQIFLLFFTLKMNLRKYLTRRLILKWWKEYTFTYHHNTVPEAIQFSKYRVQYSVPVYTLFHLYLVPQELDLPTPGGVLYIIMYSITAYLWLCLFTHGESSPQPWNPIHWL